MVARGGTILPSLFFRALHRISGRCLWITAMPEKMPGKRAVAPRARRLSETGTGPV